MRRCCGERSTPAAASKKTRSPTTMRPASGRISPARHWSVSVLPAPEGPNRPRTHCSASQLTSSVNPGKRLVIATDTVPLIRSIPQPRESAQAEQQYDNDADRDQGERVRFAHLICLDSIVDRQRQCLGSSWNVPGHHEGDPELAERTAERQNRSGEHRAPRERKRDAPEHAPLRTPEGPRRLLELPVHGFEARLGGLDDECDRPDAGGENRGCRGEGELEPERGERSADRASVPDDDEEVVDEHRGRQDQS